MLPQLVRCSNQIELGDGELEPEVFLAVGDPWRPRLEGKVNTKTELV
ncbi:MAG: hypothetical protein WBG86_08510 [Polyangiales bacterium]